MRPSHRLALALALLVVPSCSSSSPTAPGGSSGRRPTQPSASAPHAPSGPASPADPGASSSPANSAPSVEPGGASDAAVVASNALGFDLFARLRSEAGNLAFSPASIAVALSMTFAGARGETAAEMQRVLHAPEDGATLHGAWATLLADWQKLGGDEAPVIRTANRLFGDKSLKLVPDFLALTGKRYGAPLDASDFRGAADSERGRINGWVADQTNDRIRDLLPPGSIDATTRIVLTNAIYFKATWAQPFFPQRTRPDRFTQADGTVVEVPFMHQTEHLRYGETDDAQLLELGYAGGQFATLFVLPKDPRGLDALEGKLTAATYAQWAAGLAAEEVQVDLPRFELRPAASLALRPHLEALGMKKAFDAQGADFGGIATGEPLFVTDVYHKAFVAMDESGTEAAAATAVTAAKGAGGELQHFTADRPFLFLIRDRKSGIVLFIGRVATPKG